MRTSFRAALVAAFLVPTFAVVAAWAAQTNYLGTVFVADPTIPTRQMTVNADGSINATLVGSGFVSSVTGTANEITASPTTGAVILSLPTALTFTGKTVTGGTFAGPTVTGSFTATGLVTNADLANAATTVNGQTCTLGSTCTITASATSITVGSTTVGSGTTGRVLYDNAGTLGEMTNTGTGTVNVLQTSPSLITPALGVATATSLALGGGSIGSDVLEVTGSTTHNGAVSVVGASFGLSGNISTAAWTTAGVRYKNVAGTLTDTTSSGTVAAAYTDQFGGNTIAASAATTFTKYATMHVSAPTAGTNVTITNPYALDADSLSVGTSNPFTVSATGAVVANALTTIALADALTNTVGYSTIFNHTTSGTVAAGFGTGQRFNLPSAAGTIRDAADIEASWTTATDGAEGAQFKWYLNNGGTAHTLAATLSSIGQWTIAGSLVAGGNVIAGSAGQLSLNGRGIITSTGVGVIQFGAADVDTAPVAQTLRFQGPLVGGTSNVAGPNTTIIGTLGKGNANSGDIIIQTGGAVGASGTTIATATTALTIKGVTQQALFTGPVGINGASPGSNGLQVTGTTFLGGALTLGGGLAGNNTSAGMLSSANSSGWWLASNTAASATVPTVAPNKSDTTTGIGAQASGNMSMTVGGVEIGRFASTGFSTISGSITSAANSIATTFFRSNETAAPALVSVSAGSNFGQLNNVNSTTWALAYGASASANGTSVLTWNDSGAITLPTVTTGTNADTLCLSAGAVILLQAAACTISDPSLKTDKHVFTGSVLASIMSMPTWTFKFKDWKTNPDPNTGHAQLGLMAPDVARLVPLCAEFYSKGHVLSTHPKSWKQDCMIAWLTKGMQEMGAENARLRAANDNEAGLLHQMGLRLDRLEHSARTRQARN